MLFGKYIPDDFGICVTVPIPKDSSKGSNSRMEQFRGITILPVISKVFELQC